MKVQIKNTILLSKTIVKLNMLNISEKLFVLKMKKPN